MGQTNALIAVFFWLIVIGLLLAGAGAIDWASRFIRSRRVTHRTFQLPSGRTVHLTIPKCAYEPLSVQPAGIPDHVYDQEQDGDLISLIDRMRPLPAFKVSNN